MTTLFVSTNTTLKKTAMALALTCSLTTITGVFQTQAADTIDINFQNILQQER
ncbi:MAG: alpha/beta hydrolase, partial [Acinetobacter calcoaceticus]